MFMFTTYYRYSLLFYRLLFVYLLFSTFVVYMFVVSMFVVCMLYVRLSVLHLLFSTFVVCRFVICSFVVFTYRMYVKKMRHLIFYSLPTYPQFFSELCNMYRGIHQSDASCLVLFSKLEAYKLAACAGTDRARHMITTVDKSLFMFITGENNA